MIDNKAIVEAIIILNIILQLSKCNIFSHIFTDLNHFLKVETKPVPTT